MESVIKTYFDELATWGCFVILLGAIALARVEIWLYTQRKPLQQKDSFFTKGLFALPKGVPHFLVILALGLVCGGASSGIILMGTVLIGLVVGLYQGWKTEEKPSEQPE